MRPVTDAFLRTVRGSHTMRARAFVCTTFQIGTGPTGTEIPIIGGDVIFDGTADVRATLDLTTDGTAMWPTIASDLLAPYGNEVFVQRGIEYGNGSTEWCSLGYYRIQTPAQSRPPDGPIRIAGRDRMASIIDARLTKPVQYPASTTYGTVMTQLVQEVYPTATILWDDATNTQQLGRDVGEESDRFGFLKGLVTAVGKIWYWNHRGELTITAAPSTTDPVFDVNAGAGGVLVEMSRHLTRDRVYNAVVAQGEGADTTTPIRSVAVNNDPTSPTYYSGRFGPVPEFLTSPLITTQAQADTAASERLRLQLGLPYSVDFTAVPNPALEPYDAVSVAYSQRYATETHVLQTVTVPLTAEDPLTATTREQTVVLIGML